LRVLARGLDGMRARTADCGRENVAALRPTGDGMTIKVGDKLPAGTLSEFIEVETAGCTVGPNTFKIDDLTRGKKVAIFGLPGAFTPTCSAKHVPSYLANIDKLKAKGVSDVICMSVNDAFVMGALGRDQKTRGKIRMMADGSADYTKALGSSSTLPRRVSSSLPALFDAGRQRCGQ
jgi:peroxiredoxin